MPTRYARYQDRIELDPTPDREVTYTVRYRKRLPKLVEGLIIPLEREWHELLIDLTVSKGLSALQRFEEAAGAKQMIDASLLGRQDNLTLEEDNYESTIGVRFK